MSYKSLPSKHKTVIVVPTIRAERINEWLNLWKEELKKSTIIIVEDNQSKKFKITQENVIHYSWKDIDKDLKDASWIVPRRTAAIRSYGFYKAYQLKPDIVITLDDDCYPLDKDFVEKHNYYLSQSAATRWTQHAQSHLKMRGFPINLKRRPCVLNLGLWANVPDLDGVTQKANSDVRLESQSFNFSLALGQYAPISSMNIAFKPQIIPAFYFLLMGTSWEFDRFDDIWGGIIIKKIIDHLGFSISGGEPFVWHDKASNPEVNIKKEATGLKVNEYFWQAVDRIKLYEHDFKNCYLEIANNLDVQDDNTKYWNKLKQAMKLWASLY
ncbi:hypothetical protein A2V80_01695 [Candidatus Woesebacteria bacterium RBG_16_39_8b]|uniref:Glycosyltransferase 2-like domain-containing protein n=1 Tax=Candidatus Woesebacteria bacterium RBG_16_39_8b TaxID=1802482 RepID=A0A1F7XCZ0_9BACT|nr:MAG: hypothetical protein A2V80_01695 [Candidatus Woesebacteria bacterium RBG_16_39_8b]